MVDFLPYAAVAGGTLLFSGGVRRVGELIAEGGWNRILADTVERDNKKDNKQVLSALKSQQGQLEQKEKQIQVMSTGYVEPGLVKWVR
jgi:hypothetical protein